MPAHPSCFFLELGEENSDESAVGEQSGGLPSAGRTRQNTRIFPYVRRVSLRNVLRRQEPTLSSWI